MSSWITGPTDGSKQVFRLSKPFRTSRVSLSTHLEEADGRSVLGQPRAITLEVPSGRKEEWSVISVDVWYSVGCFRGWFWEKHTGLEGDFHLSFSLAVLLDLISLWLPIPKAIQLSASCGQCFLSILALLLPCLYLHCSRVLRVKGPHWNTARMGAPTHPEWSHAFTSATGSFTFHMAISRVKSESVIIFLFSVYSDVLVLLLDTLLPCKHILSFFGGSSRKHNGTL